MTQPPSDREQTAVHYDPLPLPRRSAGVSVRVLAIAVALCALLTLALIIPVPYVVRTPGPTVDTLGESGETTLITVPADQEFDSEGELRLTTVSAYGGPGYPVGAVRVLQSLFDDTSSVLPREALFPDDQSAEETAEASQVQMSTSQENATVAALEELGYEVPATLTVAGVVEGTGAVDVLSEGDLLLGVGSSEDEVTEVNGMRELSEALAVIPAGTEASVLIERDGEDQVVALVTGDDGEGGSVLGVLVAPEVTPPVQVDIALENIGGPSAGMMFALGIMERLTEGDATGGEVIAGTGTMSMSGEVGAIGGIQQKLAGARRDGATAFLAPADNCDEVVGHEPEGLTVVAVSTLGEAWDAVTAIGAGESADLPTCEDVLAQAD
ncbi:YlbL family protein [Serinibacter salmoneus]|uniref:endopeptidase La n=1 Tax=Serinibacter salmoneus TaxID=556530 RepID=A0A2A9CYC5_9MICO|nr:S16 family serine protease [Serinibacter salmoneus]PFG19141.1 PDZ domain-containing protein [Serinibacter salmoneus]